MSCLLAATIGVSTFSLTVVTTHGTVVANLLDCASQKKVDFAPNFQNAEGMVLMFSLKSKTSYNYVTEKYNSIQAVTGNIPTVLVGNQSDVPEANLQMSASNIIFHRQKNLQYSEISVKSGSNVYIPLELLLRKLIDPSVQIMNRFDFDEETQ